MLSIAMDQLFAQVGINTTNPSSESILDINAPDKGLLIPRVLLDATTNSFPTASHTTGLLIYNDNTINNVFEGFYYNSGSRWIEIINENAIDIKYVGVGNHYSIGAGTKGTHNIGIGNLSLLLNQTGKENVAVGFQALSSNTSGDNNIAIGLNNLKDNTTGVENIVFGHTAGNVTTTGSAGNYNIAIGLYALNRNLSSNYNIGLGTDALNGAYDAEHNIGLGRASLSRLRSGTTNIGFGNGTHRDLTNGANNIAVGRHASYGNNTGLNMVAFGFTALNRTKGSGNIGFGFRSSYTNTTGQHNIAFGANSLRNNSTGDYNVVFGFDAMYFVNDAHYNVAIGHNALKFNSVGEKNVAIGQSSLIRSKGDSNVGIGRSALSYLQDDAGVLYQGNTAIGYEAHTNLVHGLYNSSFGYRASYETSRTTNEQSQNTSFGNAAFVTNRNFFSNATAIGAGTVINASNMIRFGNNDVTIIGGIVDWSVYSFTSSMTSIQENVPGLEFIQKLRPVSYVDGTDKGTLNFGFIAEDVTTAAKSIGYHFKGASATNDGSNSDLSSTEIRYNEFTAPLIKTLQQQNEVLLQQEILIQQLQKRLIKLKKNTNSQR